MTNTMPETATVYFPWNIETDTALKYHHNNDSNNDDGGDNDDDIALSITENTEMSGNNKIHKYFKLAYGIKLYWHMEELPTFLSANVVAQSPRAHTQ
jgi:hypothetical protein